VVRNSGRSYSQLVDATATDGVLALLCFLGLPSGAFLYFIIREVVRLRRRRNLDRLEAEAMAAEGFPPPDPPTTDSPPHAEDPPT
jgi:hypothetical protein